MIPSKMHPRSIFQASAWIVSEPGAIATGFPTPIILDWRKIKGSEILSTISNGSLNGEAKNPVAIASGSDSEHLIFRDGVVAGENVIKLDFTSPILTSGSAITRYVDKEDGAEYIYSLFVPSDASTAFPVFDQPDLKARFQLTLRTPVGWSVVSNTDAERIDDDHPPIVEPGTPTTEASSALVTVDRQTSLKETKPISTYVFAFAAGPFSKIYEANEDAIIREHAKEHPDRNSVTLEEIRRRSSYVFVRKSQEQKFKPHAAEVFRLNREAVKYFEQYFDYKFPFPKYDLVLIPEFPFGGMEHAGATFLRESSVIFPQEPTKNDYISRATLIFHEAAHQWFGDTVTMRWFDDLWLKEGFATFTAYKALEKIMPEMNAWKVFYERIKQGAYQTDSTKGTTPIYQEIKNLSAAKSAYGNIVYNKAPAFLRQAEFYLGQDKFQTAVRAFLKKHEYGNAGWEDLVKEFETASGADLKDWGSSWVKQRGMTVFRSDRHDDWHDIYDPKKKDLSLIAITPSDILGEGGIWTVEAKFLVKYKNGSVEEVSRDFTRSMSKTFGGRTIGFKNNKEPLYVFPNYQDYGYGIFLLDAKSRDYVLKNIHNEKDDFLRTMMWGSLWDSVREGELDPRVFVELVVKNLKVRSPGFSRPSADKKPPEGGTPNATTPPQTGGEQDESTIQTLLGRVSTAMTYYMSATNVSSPHVSKGSAQQKANIKPSLTVGLQTRLESLLIDRMQNAPTLGQRITFYRAFLGIASTEKARGVLKRLLAEASTTPAAKPATPPNQGGEFKGMPLRPKDRFDIVTRLLILGDPDAPALLAGLEKAETSDEAKRYAYAAKAGIATAENKAKYWNDFVNNKEISESWIEAAFGPFNSVRHADLTLRYLELALKELPNHKRSRKIFFVNGWLSAFIGGQRSEEALAIVNKFLADNPNLDKDLRLKILENVDLIERAVKIRSKYGKSNRRDLGKI